MPDQNDVLEESSQSFQVNVLDILLVLAKRKRMIVLTSSIVAIVALLGSLLLADDYASTAVILPPRQEQSMSGLLSGQLGSLAALGGGGLSSAALSMKSPNEIYAQLLLSRTVGDRLIALYNLKARFHEKTQEGTRRALAKHTVIELDKSNLIRITVTTHDRVFSSQLANAYYDQLHDLNTTLALTESSQRRAFYERQLDQEKELLANAEVEFQQVQKKTGLLQPNGQAEMVSRNIANIRSEITVRSAQLQSLGVFATPENPDYQRLRSEISSLQAQLANLENNNKASEPGDIEIPTSKIPESATEYARKLRELRLQESVYELLIKQFEAAKIDEAKTAPMIQVVDRAVPAERKSGPPRVLITIGAFFSALVATAFCCIASFIIGIFEHDESIGPKLRMLHATLVGKF